METDKKRNSVFHIPEFKILWDILKFIWVIPLLGIIIICLYSADFSGLGPFGDFVAGTTVPLLTFISFLAIVITLRMQKEQLELQRIELKNSVEEMQATRKEFEIQNKTLAVQRFENTFFQMVSLHNDIVNSINIDGKIGRRLFRDLFNILEYYYNNVAMDNKHNNKEEIVKIRIAYNDFFEDKQQELGHYYRNLYRIIKLIDENDSLTYVEKKNYIGIIKAQLSSFELTLLLYNSLSINGQKFLLLIGKYNLFDNLNEKLLLREKHLFIYKNEYDLSK
jgi:uncharacterized membrane protein